jgi:hypothetical protein
LGSFNVVGGLSSSQLASLALWQVAQNIDVWIRDVDLDGNKDIELSGVPYDVADAWDLILYGNSTKQVPTAKTIENARFLKFHSELFNWISDNNFFENAAPLVPVAGGTINEEWYASIHDPNNTALINRWAADCRAKYEPARTCGVKFGAPPPPCYRYVAVYDNNGNYLFSTNTNICDYVVHIIIYTNVGQYTRDYSVFDPNARETADILRRLNQNCPAISNGDKSRLEQILEDYYDRLLSTVAVADRMNSWSHSPFPGDSLFNQAEPTFHHYDLYSPVCEIGATNCSLATVRDTVHRLYSFPHFQLRPRNTAVDGVSEETAYITIPGLTSYPLWYVIKAGPITQSWVLAPPYSGAIQNVTKSDHVVYPGTISRYISIENNVLGIFTHGMGQNRAFCTLNPVWKPLQVLAGRNNDRYGPKAFRALDRELIKYWKQNFNSGASAPMMPQSLPSPPQNGAGQNPSSTPGPDF